MLVSVVIPTINEAEWIRAAVASVRRDYTDNEVEIIVVDGGSVDGTPRLVPDGEVVIESAPGRAIQMNRGARVAAGDILVFCHADTLLPPSWREAVVDVLRRPEVSGGSFRIRLEPARGFLHLLNSLPYPADWRLMYGDQAQFSRRGAFERVCGFPEIPLIEDLELMRKLRKVGRLVRLPLVVTSSSRRFLKRGPLRQLLVDVWLVVRDLALKAPPTTLARVCYRGDTYGRLQ